MLSFNIVLKIGNNDCLTIGRRMFMRIVPKVMAHIEWDVSCQIGTSLRNARSTNIS